MPHMIHFRRPLGAYPMRRTTPRRRLRGLRGLGAAAAASTMTPQQAMQQAMQGVANLNPRDFQNSTWLNNAYTMIQNGQFDPTLVSNYCSQSGTNPAATDLSLTQAIGGIASAGTGVAAAATGGTISAIAAGTATAAATALGVATLGIGIVVAVLSFIFAHHAAAVHEEQQLECLGPSAANNAMNALAEGVSTGQIQPADAVTALNTVYSEYQKIVAPSWGTSPWCNANCELEIIMNAMVIYWQAQYQAMADAATAAASSAASNPASAAVQSVAASTGLPTWAILLAGGFLLYELMS
jgi:hypothetical protein